MYLNQSLCVYLKMVSFEIFSTSCVKKDYETEEEARAHWEWMNEQMNEWNVKLGI
jgi:hypothetical protein